MNVEEVSYNVLKKYRFPGELVRPSGFSANMHLGEFQSEGYTSVYVAIKVHRTSPRVRVLGQ